MLFINLKNIFKFNENIIMHMLKYIFKINMKLQLNFKIKVLTFQNVLRITRVGNCFKNCHNNFVNDHA